MGEGKVSSERPFMWEHGFGEIPLLFIPREDRNGAEISPSWGRRDEPVPIPSSASWHTSHGKHCCTSGHERARRNPYFSLAFVPQSPAVIESIKSTNNQIWAPKSLTPGSVFYSQAFCSNRYANLTN